MPILKDYLATSVIGTDEQQPDTWIRKGQLTGRWSKPGINVVSASQGSNADSYLMFTEPLQGSFLLKATFQNQPGSGHGGNLGGFVLFQTMNPPDRSHPDNVLLFVRGGGTSDGGARLTINGQDINFWVTQYRQVDQHFLVQYADEILRVKSWYFDEEEPESWLLEMNIGPRPNRHFGLYVRNQRNTFTATELTRLKIVSGEISGIVRKAKIPVIGMTVQLRQLDGVIESEATTNADGYYEFNYLGSGDYLITAFDPSDIAYRPLTHRLTITED